jgi:hypothetical protein
MMRAIRASPGGPGARINNAGVTPMNAFALTPPFDRRRINLQ